ncbi:chromate transporter [Paenibacillus qinlingensis]|uniref:Chromate transporter n=1 Tax=Paenibacillus qinlingensis TaxID=1837343 RepID=A0ABU1NP79_9BACL|nr:chromate transporter [Paenibacillus qinlingensis]MDR6549263.1 chromate transporter [Paenibacillus qinlingensis]
MSKNIPSKLIAIFCVCLRISPLTFGGGYAMLPAIQREVVSQKQWMTDDEMSELLAISGAAPGGVGVNVSALVGYRLAGVSGAVAAIVGITLPTFFIVLLLSLLYAWLAHYPKMQAIMDGIHAAIIGLIAAAAYRMAKSAILDKLTLLTAIGTVIVMFSVPISPLVLVILGVVVGMIAMYLKYKWGMNKPVMHTASPPPTSKDNKTADFYMADGI